MAVAEFETQRIVADPLPNRHLHAGKTRRTVAAGGITTDRILADVARAKDVRALMDEIAAAARHLGYEVPEKFIRQQIDVTPPMGAYKPSSPVDFLAGHKVEIEAILGASLRRAEGV